MNGDDAAEAFAKAHPATADRLTQKGVDPDVERLVEGFAYLATKIESVLDSTAEDAALHSTELLAPELLRPFPSATIVEVSPGDAPIADVAAGAEFASVTVDGSRVRFVAHAPFTLSSRRVEGVKLGWSKKHETQTLDVVLSETRFSPRRENLRLHISSELQTSLSLIAWLDQHLDGIEIGETELSPSAVRLWGLRPEEALLPSEPLEHPGYRLLRELLLLPSKFSFFEVTLPELPAGRLTLRFRFTTPLPSNVSFANDALRTNCVPVVNAVSAMGEPVAPSLELPQVRLRPAGMPNGEIYAVRDATARANDGSVVPLSSATAFGPGDLSYSLHRSPCASGRGVDFALSLNTRGDTRHYVVSTDLWVTNRNAAESLGLGDVRGVAPFGAYRNIAAVTPYRSPTHGLALLQRSLAFLTMTARPTVSLDVLRSLFYLFDLHAVVDAQARRAYEKRNASLHGARSAPIFRSIGGAVARGYRIDLELAETQGEGEAFLLAAILARLFAHETPLGAFTETHVVLAQTGRRFQFEPMNDDLDVS